MRREPLSTEKYHSNEISALLLGGLAVMLILSLYSYSPENLPSWVPFSQAQETEPSGGGNFIGPIGGIVAGSLYFICGAAAYLIPLVLIWWAIQIVATERFLGIRNYIAVAIFITSAACIVDCQTMFFQNWVELYHLPKSVGGYAGYWVGHEALVRFFGPGGSFIIMSIVSLLTLVVITGIHPFRLLGLFGEKIFRALNKIDWEKEWKLWTGMHLKEPNYPPTRFLPAAKTINVDPIVTDEDFIRETDSYTIDEDPIEKVYQQQQPQHHPHQPAQVLNKLNVPYPEKTGIPSPERIRRIIDASQAQQQGNTSPLLKSPENQMLYGSKPQYADYQLPPLEILSYAKDLNPNGTDDETLIEVQNHIINTLKCFNVDVEPGDITKGPTITRYELYPSPGLRVNKIAALKDDLARATRAEKINILAPIPGKDTVGIEIANSTKITVAIRELFESDIFRNSTAKLPLVLGKDVYGKAIVGDLAKMPHLLVAGATGSGKSVCINSIIASLLYRFTPDELRFIMIDPKVVEMQLYNALPHMVVPVVTDPKKVPLALRWVINEMDSRYEMFAKKGTRNFEGFNSLREKEARAREIAEGKILQPNLINTETGEDFMMDGDLGECADPAIESPPADDHFPERLPYIVVIVDELADLMQTAPADVETGIARIAQKARAAGIHLIIATQTPRADVITGTIKANIPSRIAFQVSSKTDSRIILDANGAENLVGKGDMLYLPPGSAKLIRAQGALITDDEAHALVKACASQGSPDFEGSGEDFIFDFMEDDGDSEVSDADEEMISKCMEVIFTERKASTSLLQRKLRLGYTRAARMIDILESRGIIGPGDGAKARDILIDLTVE